MGRGGRLDGGCNRLVALALASAPVAVLLAVAVMTTMHNPAYDIPPGMLLSCYHNWPPPYPGHEDEVRAIAARGGEPGPGPLRDEGDEYVEYFIANSRQGPNLIPRAIQSAASSVPGYSGDAESLMKTVAAINWYNAPAGPCVWEHEYIAGGGSLLDLEYDEGRECYLAGNGTEPASCGLPERVTAGAYSISCFAKEPAPYELADEETRALIQRAGPAPNGSVLEYAVYLSPDRFSMTGPAPNGSVLEYVVQNTRVDLAGPGSPNIAVAFALNHTGGDAYRAVKMLNREWVPTGEGCVMESFWVGWGNRLTDLRYSDEHRCYLAPPEVRAKPLDTPCFP